MSDTALLWWACLAPALAALVVALWPGKRGAMAFMVAATVTSALLQGALAVAVWRAGRPLTAASGWLYADALSAFHLGMTAITFILSGLFCTIYFGAHGGYVLPPRVARNFAALWLGSQASMAMILVSNNLGIMWVGMEATSLLTAFLVSVRPSKASLEAMWKYLMICSVGIAFAFMGTLIAAAAVPSEGRALAGGLLWTEMAASAGHLDPTLMRIAFVFLLVGYGTKAGLAPMHSWLPDAYTEAPGPVSAMSSGCILNAAIFCILRYLPIVRGATHSPFAANLMVLLGVSSIVIAASFILSQRDAKRLLAYCSVEHVGIICLGFGLGPLGAFAALFHSLNHAVSKSLAFFSVARLSQGYRSHEMASIRGALRANRVWGVGLLASILALIGAAPFALFISEIALVRALVHAAAWPVLVITLGGTSIIFIAMLARVIGMAMGEPPEGLERHREGLTALIVVGAPLLLLLTLGVWMPAGLRLALDQAVAVVGVQP